MRSSETANTTTTNMLRSTDNDLRKLLKRLPRLLITPGNDPQRYGCPLRCHPLTIPCTKSLTAKALIGCCLAIDTTLLLLLRGSCTSFTSAALYSEVVTVL